MSRGGSFDNFKREKKGHPLDAFFAEHNFQPLNLPAFLHDSTKYNLSLDAKKAARHWVVDELTPYYTDDAGKVATIGLETPLDAIKDQAKAHADLEHQATFRAFIEFVVDQVLLQSTDKPTKRQMMAVAGAHDEASLRQALIDYLRAKYGE